MTWSAPLSQAIRVFAQGNPARTVQLLRPVRSIAHRFGGSHAQRDLIDLTLLKAAWEDGAVCPGPRTRY